MEKKLSETVYQLFDGTVVSESEILETAEKYHGTFKGLGSITLAGVLITSIALITDLPDPRIGYVLSLVTIDIVFLILTVLFFGMYHKMDQIKFGLSVMNFKRRQAASLERSTDDYNEIEADEAIELSLKFRHFVFINTKTKFWQYRIGRTMSTPLKLNQIKAYGTQVKNKMITECVFTLIDGSSFKMISESVEKAERLHTFFK